MLTLRKIAITGTIGSGKSVVCNMFRKLGAYVVETDAIVHELLTHDQTLQHNLKQHFGSEVFNGLLPDREKLAEVFKDRKRLDILEGLIHPRVFTEIEKHYQQAKRENFPLFIVEIPLLFECHREKDFDKVLLVTAKPEVIKKRLKEHLIKNVTLRMKRLLPQKLKEKKADIILENNESLDILEKNVKKLMKQFMQN